MESHKVAGTSNAKTFLWPNGFNSGCFQLHTSQNVATLMPSLTSQSCSDSLLVVCLARQVGAIYRPPKQGQGKSKTGTGMGTGIFRVKEGQGPGQGTGHAVLNMSPNLQKPTKLSHFVFREMPF